MHSKAFAQFRRALNVSGPASAAFLGIDCHTLSDVENGRVEITEQQFAIWGDKLRDALRDGKIETIKTGRPSHKKAVT